MDMTERDDELLMHFFSEHKQEIFDNGFSERVMQKLPRSAIRTYNRLWTLFCCMVGLAFILLTRGWEQVTRIGHILSSQFYDALYGLNLTSFTPVVLFVAMLTFIGVTVYNLNLSKD